MRILIIFLFASSVCFGQGIVAVKPGNKIEYSKTLRDSDKINVDSMDIPVISMKEFNKYLERISIVSMKQFDLTEKAKYDAILKELLVIQAEVDKKRKSK